MSDLESEESVKQTINQKREGLKILTPNQRFSRLPNTLAQLKTGNNSEKLKMNYYYIFCIVQKSYQNNL